MTDTKFLPHDCSSRGAVPISADPRLPACALITSDPGFREVAYG